MKGKQLAIVLVLLVVLGGIACGELLLLGPGVSVANKHIRRAGIIVLKR